MLRNFDSWISMLQTDPLGALIYFLFFAAALLISLMLHEIGHGFAALCCGDPTAKMLHRLSINPARHLDPIGTIFMALFGFGWAKPVPVNPRNFKHYRRDSIIVSAAGILVNLTLFLISILFSVIVLYYMAGNEFILNVLYHDGTTAHLQMTDIASRKDIYWLFVSYQLDGLSKSELTRFMAVPWLQYVMQFLTLMCSFNLGLAFFNLLPVPPLDGYRLLNDTVFKGQLQIPAQYQRYLSLGLLVLCWTGVLNGLLTTCINATWGFFLQIFLSMLP